MKNQSQPLPPFAGKASLVVFLETGPPVNAAAAGSIDVRELLPKNLAKIMRSHRIGHPVVGFQRLAHKSQVTLHTAGHPKLRILPSPPPLPAPKGFLTLARSP